MPRGQVTWPALFLAPPTRKNPVKMPAVGQSAAKTQVIPAGNYKVRISESEMRKSSRTNNEYLYLRLQVAEGPYRGHSLYSTIMFKTNTFYLRKKGQKQWVELLNSLGWTRCPDESNLIGQELAVDVVNKEKDGGTFTEVKRFSLPKTAVEVVEDSKQSKKKAGFGTW